ncbi:MAG: AraC family transcriptional regulator [Lachnospiraceae bacterium]|nr:AraC family transcriptional regulator [Lachnospiraceae bacterium]
MLYLEKMAARHITSANYITSVNGMVHPDRVLPEHDFLYMLDGEMEVFEDGTVYEMQSDDLLILTAGRHHYGKKLCNPGNRHMYFHVLPTERETMWNRDAEEQFCLPCATLLHCKSRPQIRRCFQELISEYWSESPVRLERLSLYFNLILCELTLLQAEEAEDGKLEPMIEAAREQIQSNPQIFFTPQEMADHFFVCPRTLNNHFQRACGKTFSAYQMDLKLEMVREFLVHQPQAKLHEAAVNFGFYDEFHLSKAFRRKYGQPPSQYRRAVR